MIIFLLYVITSSGDIVGDTDLRWNMAKQTIETGWFDLPADSSNLITPGSDGKWYSFYGPAQSLCFIPFVIAGKATALLPLPFTVSGDIIGQFLASLFFFPLCGALAAILLYAIVFETTKDSFCARYLTLIFVTGTMFWHHTINTYEESQVAVCLLLSIFSIIRFWKKSRLNDLLIMFFAMGIAISFRPSAVVAAFPIGITGLVHDLIVCTPGNRYKRFNKWITAGMIAFLPFLIFAGIYNFIRFGSIFETGYKAAHLAMADGILLFDTPLYTGLTGLLFSPGKSVFLYNPVLLLAIPGIVLLYRSYRPLAYITISVITATTFFHSKYTYWSGDLSWGPRYFASIMGIALFALIPVLQWRRAKWLVSTLVALSICIQIASVTYSFSLEYFQDGRHGTIPDNYVWRIDESQMLCRFQNIALHIAGIPNYNCIPPEKEIPDTWNIYFSRERVKQNHTIAAFPFKARSYLGNKNLFNVLLLLWLGCLVMLFTNIALWIKKLNSFKLTGKT
jgi:hypothetical protein